MTSSHRFDGDDCYITIADGSEIVVDRDKAGLVTPFAWGFWPSSRTVRRLVQQSGQRKSVHVADVLNPPPAGYINDHRDGDSRNNRTNNLRFATQHQNCMNRAVNKSKDGYKGVSRSNAGKYGKYRARIRIDGVTTSLGAFDDPESAALAYDKAARERFGSFAALNFPGPGERQA